jgi:hypothetical protein
MLPKPSFLPNRKLSEQERRTFIERRDKLFLLCTPAEQQWLIKFACWYESQRFDVLGETNVFKQSFLAVLYHRHFPWANSKPNLAIRILAMFSAVIYKVERWQGNRFQSNVINYMHSAVDKGNEDVLLSVLNFFRVLPLDVGFEGQRAFENTLNAMINECIESDHVSALRRFNAVQRCVQWSYGPTGLQGGASAADLRKLAWPLLLKIANENIEAAVSLIDEHWNQKKTRPPEILMSLHLHETPELAYRLAVKLKPHRPEFASDMLRQSIFYASFQLKRLDQPPTIAIEKVMDASCQLLADWTFDNSTTSAQCCLLSADHLFRFGDPSESYWQRISPECLAMIKALEPAEQDKQLRLLAQVVFYGDSASPLVIEAHELFEKCVSRRIGQAQGRNWEWDLQMAISDVCKSLSILEDKVLSFRNRRIAANPTHPLLSTVDKQLQDFLERFLSNEPSTALSRVVSFTLELANQTLIRKHHRFLRDQFEAKARLFPVDAGRALKQLIQYCGYSQLDDEMYRKDLCRDSFNALLPILQGISPTDAAVAATGIGWSPRGDI